MGQTVTRVARIGLVGLTILVALPLLTVALVGGPPMGWWAGGHMAGDAWGGGVGAFVVMALWMLVPLLAVLGGGYLLLRALGGDGERGGDRALEELRVAYARGELTDEEYESRRQRLERET
ncbi:SHOCT domain-containing protein [Haloprofundus sp. MHR1]|uniref:SHOCT domain-containing protein n=1 Tax=Haloprofundus sp. MHR1 TaxID=2572921 RepID=UPI0010BEE62D|nr:SHOCT domain-containing protein [Haloprofundus sp. MHR1]QCJ45743.1 SHOCT domain-containing protein [Haloprofundus sp. MHR1]